MAVPEVALALDAGTLLLARDVRARVVALPCWELFRAQPRSYQDAVLPPEITARVGVEAATGLGWERWLGRDGVFVGVDDRFGASAPAAELYTRLGITAEHIADAALRLLGRSAAG